MSKYSRNLNTDPVPVKMRILDKEVQLACKPGEEDDLAVAAAHVDRSMRDLRQRNTTSSIEKIAIVTAINMAAALMASRDDKDGDQALAKQIASLNAEMDQLLSEA